MSFGNHKFLCFPYNVSRKRSSITQSNQIFFGYGYHSPPFLDQIMKPQYLVYDHNRFSAKMLVKFYYFLKKLSKIGSRTAWQLHGTCTPLILMSKPCHTGVSLYQYTGHGGGSFHFAACGSLIVPLAPCRGSWRISPQARRILNVSDCPMLRMVRFLCQRIMKAHHSLS